MNTITVSEYTSRLQLRRWWKPVLTVVLLGISVVFVQREGPELAQALRQLPETPIWVAGLSVGVTALYLLGSGLIYVAGFRAGGARVPLGEAMLLWLRRNFLSVFLPAGGVSSLAFYNRSLRQPTASRPALSDQSIYAGSLVYLMVSNGSLLLVAMPVLALGLGRGLLGNVAGSVGVLLGLVLVLFGLWQSFRQRGWAYRTGQRYAPAMLEKLESLRTGALDTRPVLLALAASVGVELCGMAHVALAIRAVGGQPTVALALSTYVVATLFFALSPVMRGLGVVETSMTLVLMRGGGLPLPLALAITLYYRLFEFWLPLLLGLFSFIWQRGNVLLRVLPAFLTLVLGVINLLSALTPALTHRLRLLEGLLPTEVIEASRYVVIGAGLCLVVLSVGLLRGYRPAWTLTAGLVALSLVTHLTKAIDYEESLFAGTVLLVLLFTRSHYQLAAPSLRRLTRIPIRRRTSRPVLNQSPDDAYETARQLTTRFGRSTLDYFKLYPDKEIRLLPESSAFVAYRLSGRYAVVLEGPVGPVDQFAQSVRAFDILCHQRGYQSLYYRVDRDDLG
ncbi:MAG: lysylphosphatidylglycerol synthase domain-containing protein, partial [Rudanella sp.]|nr:lysylphosphatidylglycerol synthase domain-containing protein [Rudanella sp.]